jgi:hypothetical protein
MKVEFQLESVKQAFEQRFGRALPDAAYQSFIRAQGKYIIRCMEAGIESRLPYVGRFKVDEFQAKIRGIEPKKRLTVKKFAELGITDLSLLGQIGQLLLAANFTHYGYYKLKQT